MTRKSLLGMLALGMLIAAPVFAQNGNFDKNHPRRAQVNKRVKNEKAKNNAAAASGKITQKQANKLNREDNHIKQEQRADAAANGGHISAAQQAQLNQQENHVNAQRNSMEQHDAANGTAPNGQ